MNIDEGGLLIHNAIREGKLQAVNELVKIYGKNIVNNKDKNGRTPLHTLCLCDEKQQLEIDGCFFNAIELEQKSKCDHILCAILTLFYHGANINDKDNYGKTALTMAIENKRTDIVDALLNPDGHLMYFYQFEFNIIK